MQAWVTSGGLSNSHSQPGTSASGFDGLGNSQKRHVYQTQPLPPPVQDNPQPQSRAPIINANAGRITGAATTTAAAAAATRIAPRPSRLGHYREGSVPIARARTTAASDPAQTARPAPFWEGSTIEGSLGSDTASIADANSGHPSQYHAPASEPSYKPREIPRHRPFKKEPPSQDNYPPFVIGPNGVIEKVGGPLTRSASTPDARNHRGGFKGTALRDSDRDSEDSPYQNSPEKLSPSTKRLHHPKQLPVRPSRRGSFSERTKFPTENNPASPTMQPAYQDLENDMEEQPPVDIGRLRVKTQDPQRSTIFADTDTPLGSHPDSEAESVEQPTPKPVTKPKPQVARQLFTRHTKSRTSLHESAMPRLAAEKRHPNSKKRSFELDYDDSALAHMNYSQLRQEPFDYNPAQAEAQSVEFPPRGTLPEKLTHFQDKEQAAQV